MEDLTPNEKMFKNYDLTGIREYIDHRVKELNKNSEYVKKVKEYYKKLKNEIN